MDFHATRILRLLNWDEYSFLSACCGVVARSAHGKWRSGDVRGARVNGTCVLFFGADKVRGKKSDQLFQVNRTDYGRCGLGSASWWAGYLHGERMKGPDVVEVSRLETNGRAWGAKYRQSYAGTGSGSGSGSTCPCGNSVIPI